MQLRHLAPARRGYSARSFRNIHQKLNAAGTTKKAIKVMASPIDGTRGGGPDLAPGGTRTRNNTIVSRKQVTVNRNAACPITMNKRSVRFMATSPPRAPAGADTRLWCLRFPQGTFSSGPRIVGSILSPAMPFYNRVYSPGQLQFITTSTYRRTPLFLSDRFRRCFVQRLEEVRQELHFLLIGWVLMPEHFHILIKPEPAETTPLMMKGLKEESAKRIIRTLRENLQYPWCRKTLARLRLPSTVHDESHYRLWQRRFYPFNVFSEKKFQEKLDYMHNNPVTRGLVSSPGDWPWSSWRFYYLQDASILRMDRIG